MFVNPDEVAQLWSPPSPRFIQIMRSSSQFQHPQYFYSQADKLVALLDRICIDGTAFGTFGDYFQAKEILSQLLNETRNYSVLTREQLKWLEPNVRAFIDRIQAVDGLVEEWNERKRTMVSKPASKKRGRSDDEEVAAPVKRRTDSCGGEMMDMEAAFNTPFTNTAPWMQNVASRPVGAESFYG